jgi:hypothetical protein
MKIVGINFIDIIDIKEEMSNEPIISLYGNTNVARATCSLFFEKFENSILKFFKNWNLILVVDNVVIYYHANFQVEIPYILSCAKMTNYDIYNTPFDWK